MDKFEYNAKLEEISRLAEQEDYEEAAKVADSIEWKRVRNVRTLCMISEIYEASGQLDESKQVLLRAYRRSPIGRNILYRLTEVAVKLHEFDDAVEYYTEFVNAAPNDNNKYILKYKIYRGRGSSLEEQISILEECKHKEYTERWAYELAKLYQKAGEIEKCVQECDDIALWFHNGGFVVKALELKKRYAPLTPEQQTVYDNPSEIVDLKTKEETVTRAVPKLEKKILKSMPKTQEEAMAANIIDEAEKEIAASVSRHKEEKEREIHANINRDVDVEKTLNLLSRLEKQKEIEDIPVAPSYNTADLQEELAKNMREILSGVRKVKVEDQAPAVSKMTYKDKSFTVLKDDDESLESADKDEIHQDAPSVSIDDVLTGMNDEAEESEEIISSGADLDAEDDKQGDEAEKTMDSDWDDNDDSAEDEEYYDDDDENLEPDVEEVPEKEEVPQEDKTEDATIDLSEAIEAAANTSHLKAGNEKRQIQKEKKIPKSVSDPLYRPAPELNEFIRKELTDIQKETLGYFAEIKGFDCQLAEAIGKIMGLTMKDRTSKSGNVLITGAVGSGRTTLGINLAKVLSQEKRENAARVAKVYAEDFNKKDIPVTVSKISGGTLVIEEAGDLDAHAVETLSRAMEFKTDGLLVILEDEKRYIRELLSKHPGFASKFDVNIAIPVFTNDELVQFGKRYADHLDYKIQDQAIPILYEQIGAIQTPEHPVVIADVKEIVDKAIRHVERFGARKIFSSLSGKRFDEEDRIILNEKDFR